MEQEIYNDTQNEETKVKRPRVKSNDISELKERVDNLENCLAKIATLSGNGNHLAEYNLQRWIPTKKDMTRHG